MIKTIFFIALISASYSKPVTDNNDDANNPEYGNHFQGDIILPKEGLPQIGSYNAILNKNLRWPNGVLHYRISESQYTPVELALIYAGIDDLMELTRVNGQLCVDLRQRTSQSDYVSVVKGSGCSSFIGRRGGSQSMSLASGCVTRHGTIMHEFLHALGFYHEQSRGDRDDFVVINWDNIVPGYERNFVKYEDGVSIDHMGTTYDYGSAMHYGRRGFAIDPNQDTITPIDPTAEIGQRVTLSPIDIERVQLLYECISIEESKYFKNMEQVFGK